MLNAKAGSFALNTGTGNQSVTGLGFQPTVVFFWLNDRTSDGTHADAIYCFGVGISATDRRSAHIASDDANATTAVARGRDNAKCFVLETAAGTVTLSADFVSQDSGGFTINITATDGIARICNYLALGGDVTNAKSGQFQETTTAGANINITGVGFKPDCVIFFESRGSTTAPPTTGAGSFAHRFGFAASSTQEALFASRSVSGAADSNTMRYQKTDGVWAVLVDGAPNFIDSEFDFVSMNADGFTYHCSNAAGSAYYNFYIALKGGQYKVGSFNQATGTGDQTLSGVGFQPRTLMLVGVNNTTQTTIQDQNRFSIGVATAATERFSLWFGDTDAQATTIADSDLDQTKLLKHMTEGTPTVDAAVDLSSFNGDGATLTWSTADATAREIVYLAIGDSRLLASGNLLLMGVG